MIVYLAFLFYFGLECHLDLLVSFFINWTTFLCTNIAFFLVWFVNEKKIVEVIVLDNILLINQQI